MHERHALHHAFLGQPDTVKELVAALPPNQLEARCHVDDEEAAETVRRATEWLGTASRDARPLSSAAGGYYVYAESGAYFLEGVLYPRRGQADETSPVALVDRFGRTLVYGPKVVKLATTMLGSFLAYVALGGSTGPDEQVTHRDVFVFAPWPAAIM